jgi:hypothetical protein
LREEHRLKVLEKRMLRKLFRPKRDKVTRKRERVRMICAAHQVPFGRSNQEGGEGRGMYPVRETGEMLTGFGWEDVRGRTTRKT